MRDPDPYYLGIALKVSLAATCPRLSVGAVLVKDNHIIATGFNGSETGAPHCTDVGCLMVADHCTRPIHAEENTLLQCALHGVSSKGATMYCTHEPCDRCIRRMKNAGVTRWVTF